MLRLMDKGVRAIQNVNLLRWARYYGIEVDWNLLWGFPGETAADYTAAAAVPWLVHLRPPVSADRVWLERFSPLYAQPERFPMRYREPERSYAYVYPKTVDLDRVAYFFEYALAEALPESAYQPLRDAVAGWTARWATGEPPEHTYRAAPDYLQIYDERRPGREGTYEFTGPLVEIYLACSERPISVPAVVRRLGLPVPAVEEAVAGYAERGLMFCDGGQVLSLALPAVPGR